MNLDIIIKLEKMETICLLLTPRKGWSNQDEKSNAADNSNELENLISSINGIKDFIVNAKTLSVNDFKDKVIKHGKPIKTEEILSLLYGVLDLRDCLSVDTLNFCIGTIKDYITLNATMDRILNDAVDKVVDDLSNYVDDRIKHNHLYDKVKANLADVPTEVIEAILKERQS